MQPTSLNQDSIPIDNTLNIQLGDVICALKCPDNEMYEQLQKVYCEYKTEQSPDITVELEATNRLPLEKLEAAVCKIKYIPINGKDFKTSNRLMSGHYNPARRLIKLKGERALLNPDLKINHLNRLLVLTYYTACKHKYNNTPPAMFVHTCGILRNGMALLFTGPSGAGKTTIASLCSAQDGELINDEMLLVSRPDESSNEIVIKSAPMLGQYSPRRNITAPLRCIFLLKKGTNCLAHRLDKTEAYIKFIRQVVSPACIGQKDKKSIYSMMADFSVQVTGSIPMYELEFSLDVKSLWKTIADTEKLLGIKEHLEWANI
jgi:hypothetical protein